MSSYPKDRWVDIRGLRLHYRDWGGSGRSIVLMHGLASTCHIWDLVAPFLRDDFRVVALDQRGHGESDKPDHGYDMATVTGDLHSFVKALDLGRPLVVGHSWGASVGLQYAAIYADVCAGLCLVDGGTIEVSSGPQMTLERAKQELAPPDFTGLTVVQLEEKARLSPLGSLLSPEIQEIMLTNFEVLGDGTVRARLSRDNHMRIIEAMWEHHPSALYPRVRCPVLLMPARETGVPSPMARRFNREEAVATAERGLSRRKTVWLENSIHDVPLQRPQLVADVIGRQVRKGFFR